MAIKHEDFPQQRLNLGIASGVIASWEIPQAMEVSC